jgi:hypothetical protein
MFGARKITFLLTQNDTPHPQVPPISYLPETREDITMLEDK